MNLARELFSDFLDVQEGLYPLDVDWTDSNVIKRRLPPLPPLFGHFQDINIFQCLNTIINEAEFIKNERHCGV